jgi:hypothetical protein
MVVTIVALITTFILAHRRGYSPLEMISAKVDRIFVEAIRNRFPISAKHV